jgi:uncharacterized membrane protein
MEPLTKYFLYFIIYAFLGYIAEVIYVFICTKKITNRGYLYGPLVPIYGFGAIGILLSLSFIYNLNTWYSPILVFVAGFILTSLLEYIVSFFMELIFHMRWWDYSDKFLNINGRVCLRNSTMFAILVMLVMYLLHPFVVENLVSRIENFNLIFFYILSGILFTLVLTDSVLSTLKHVSIAKVFKKLEAMAATIGDSIVSKTLETKDKLDELKDYFSSNIVKRSFRFLDMKYASTKIKLKSEHLKVSLLDFKEKIKDKIQGE